MAEEKRELLSNPWLLMVGVILGLVAAVTHYIHITQLERKHEKDSFKVLMLTQDVKVHDLITKGHIRVVDVPQDFNESFKSAMPGHLRHSVINRRAIKEMYRYRIILVDDFKKGAGASDDIDPPRGFVVHQLVIDSKKSPGALLKPGMYVDIVGKFNFGSRKNPINRTRTVMKFVQVQAIDGKTRLGEARKGRMSFRKISIFVKPGQSVMLHDLQNHIVGDYKIDVTSSEEGVAAREHTIASELVNLIRKRRGG